MGTSFMRGSEQLKAGDKRGYIFEGHILELIIDEQLLIEQPSVPTDIDDQFDLIIQKTNLDIDLFLDMPGYIKYNLIRMHEQQFAKTQNTTNWPEQLKLINENSPIVDLVCIHEWLSEGAKTFVGQHLAELITRLQSLLHSSNNEILQYKNYDRLYVVLEIIDSLCSNQTIIQNVTQFKEILTQILQALTQNNAQINSVIFSIFSKLCWSSNDGSQCCLIALQNYNSVNNGSYQFSLFYDVLANNTNIIIVKQYCEFLMMIIESSDLTVRIQLKEELIVYGISLLLSQLRGKITQNKYNIFDCYCKQSAIVFENNRELSCLENDQMTEFKEIQLGILAQLQAFEEFIQEADSEELHIVDNPLLSSAPNSLRESVIPNMRTTLGQLRNSMNFTSSNRVSVGVTNLQQLYVSEKLVDALQELHKDILESKSLQQSKCFLERFVNVSSTQGINMFTQIISTICSQIREASGSLNMKSESESKNLTEKIRLLEIEIQQLNQKGTIGINMTNSISFEQKELNILNQYKAQFLQIKRNIELAKQLSLGSNQSNSNTNTNTNANTNANANTNTNTNSNTNTNTNTNANANTNQQHTKYKLKRKQTHLMIMNFVLKVIQHRQQLSKQSKNKVADIQKIPEPPIKLPMPPPPPPPQLKGKTNQQRVRRIPRVAMKAIMWDHIKSTKNTIFEGIDDTQIQLDFDILEKLFQIKPPATLKPNNQQGMKIRESKLPSDRGKNVELVLCKLKMSNQVIINAIWSMDTKQLTQEIIESLINILPTDQEVTYYKTDLDIKSLSIPDIYFYELIKVPAFKSRLLSIRAFHSFQPNQIEDKLNQLNTEIDKLLQDNNLKKVLAYFLAVGNFLNCKAKNADSYGFKISDCIKLLETKSIIDRNTKLLNLVIQQIEKQEGSNLIDAEENLMHYQILSKCQLQYIQQDINQLYHDHQELKKAINSQTEYEFDQVKFRMDSLNQEISLQYQTLSRLFTHTQSRFEQLCNYFCEDPKKIESDKLFEHIYLLKQQLQLAKRQFIQEQFQMQRDNEVKQIQQVIQQRKSIKSINNQKQNIENNVHQTKDKMSIMCEIKERQTIKEQINLVHNMSLAELKNLQKQLRNK